MGTSTYGDTILVEEARNELGALTTVIKRNDAAAIICVFAIPIHYQIWHLAHALKQAPGQCCLVLVNRFLSHIF